jgi:hypothetical protein
MPDTGNQSSLTGQSARAVSDVSDDDKLLLAAIEHLRSYFENRRSQRLQVINYFLLSIAFMSAAYVTALSNKLNGVAAVLPIIGIGVTAGFWWSDMASRTFLHLTDEPLLILERRLADRLGVPELNLMKRSKRLVTWKNSPSRLVSTMYLLAIVVLTLGTVYALVR